MKVQFFKCNHCGNIVVKYVDGGVTPSCCGEPMTELVPQTTEGPFEKHLPVLVSSESDEMRATGKENLEPGISCAELKIRVGDVAHPMKPEHHIEFIFLETQEGGQLVELRHNANPEASFCVCKCHPTAVYEYCNIHGLWKKEIAVPKSSAGSGY